MGRFRSLVGSEAIALVSAICIVGIFLGAYYQRQMDSNDQQALKVAQQVYQILTPAPASGQTLTPKAEASPAQSLQEKLAKGLKDPAPIQIKVLDNAPDAWKVLVWHPKGVVHYVVTPKGVTQGVR
ncbi:MAG: hypothetical protein K9K65_18655 [Desulfarculaceae bacterium]|nr:hypothetical protein [Desulfarculaceae bacterium]MCF8066231.1 hypothetical protein [Desulfarculaceae bacterium]MCF8099866.1 hypothetical protein [Desulfarculaceae bacterium]MCF8123983.1 hypothetical protein [Desulfarculaceae bacterium]